MVPDKDLTIARFGHARFGSARVGFLPPDSRPDNDVIGSSGSLYGWEPDETVVAPRED